jgi:hypothetical protein
VIVFTLRIEFYYELSRSFSFPAVAAATDFAGSAIKDGFATPHLPRIRDQLLNPTGIGDAFLFVASVEHELNVRWSDEVTDMMVEQTPQVVVATRTAWPGDGVRGETIGELQDKGWRWTSGNQIAW